MCALYTTQIELVQGGINVSYIYYVCTLYINVIMFLNRAYLYSVQSGVNTSSFVLPSFAPTTPFLLFF